MNPGSLNEDELRDFAQRLGHQQAGGCSEWVLLDPRNQEIRATGLFTDVDLLLATLPMYAEMYNVQVCRNPRPLAALLAFGAPNQFNRSNQRIVPLEQLEMLTQTVLTLLPRGSNAPEAIAEAACGLMVRMGIGKYSVEQGGPVLCMRIPMEPTPLRSYGSSESVRALFAKLEDAFRSAMRIEERELFEIAVHSSPELYDPPVGLPQIVGNLQLPGRRLYAPADAADPVLPQLLADLQGGKALSQAAQAAAPTTGLPQLEGLVTDWEDEENLGSEAFVEGNGILPKGAPLRIESEEGKQAKGQLEALENTAREGFLRRLRHRWQLPWPSKTLTQALRGGSRPGEVALLTSSSHRILQDYLGMALENALKQAEVLGFFASTRMSAGDFWVRSLERHTGKPLTELEGMSDAAAAAAAQAQVRSLFPRPAVMLSLSPDETLEGLSRQIRELRESDEALSKLPGILVLDGFDDFCCAGACQALRRMRHLAMESHLSVWLSASDASPLAHSALDLRARLVTGTAELQEWCNALSDADPEKDLARQVLPHLLASPGDERQPSVLQASLPAFGVTKLAWQLWYPLCGRFQNLAPRKDG
jgi:hypothetical protein